MSGRISRGARRSTNWIQLLKFCAVGASGYVVNLCVFSAAVTLTDLHYLAAATIAFLVAVTNNFFWNRRWTFGMREGSVTFQSVRFFAVSAAAFGGAATLLLILVDGLHVPEVIAQATSIVGATPMSFAGNKMWTFRQASRSV